MLPALGGRDNVVEVEAFSTRVRLTVRDDSRVDAAELARVSPRGAARAGPQVWHVIVGAPAQDWAQELRALPG